MVKKLKKEFKDLLGKKKWKAKIQNKNVQKYHFGIFNIET
tara:strand:- start:334 stop:453 length:120 start_codon:yes stop_codon:yes gene_type:complete